MLNNSLLATADDLSDHDLLARLDVLARNEREACVELVAHLAVLDTRPCLYAAGGYGSLFTYCTQALRLSEDAACNRIEAARACRRFPPILGLLASCALSLTTVRLIGRHLTAENHEDVLDRAANRSRREVELLVAGLAPRPDAPPVVRKLSAPTIPPRVVAPCDLETETPAVTEAPPVPPVPAAPRPAIQPLTPERYRLQCTIDAETQDQLRRLQDLLRREIPSGDPGAIVKRALALLLARVESRKLGKTARPRQSRPVIPPGTDNDAPEGPMPARDPVNAVRRVVWDRDDGRCGYVSPTGRRCTERAFLEFHHQRPYGLRGQATVDNIALRCRRHNQYEAELVFGPLSFRFETSRNDSISRQVSGCGRCGRRDRRPAASKELWARSTFGLRVHSSGSVHSHQVAQLKARLAWRHR